MSAEVDDAIRYIAQHLKCSVETTYDAPHDSQDIRVTVKLWIGDVCISEDSDVVYIPSQDT